LEVVIQYPLFPSAYTDNTFCFGMLAFESPHKDRIAPRTTGIVAFNDHAWKILEKSCCHICDGSPSLVRIPAVYFNLAILAVMGSNGLRGP